jgi:PIN domain nuclease of toxin-antitoxin system
MDVRDRIASQRPLARAQSPVGDLGKLRIPSSVEEGIEESGFQGLGVDFKHAERIAALPMHHRDSFDRMLIAQAQAETLTIVTADRRFEPYGVPVLWA